MTSLKLLCIGEEWRGSNSSGLFYALARCGCLVHVVNEQKFISTSAASKSVKGFHYLLRPLQVMDFNRQLLQVADYFRPDVVLVYKGTFVQRATLDVWKRKGIPLVNFFPDVSFLAHGLHIPKCISAYDHILTTKTFAAHDLARNFSFPPQQVTFIPHGFDPAVHRRLPAMPSEFYCDVSFVGNYSPHKQSFLLHLKQNWQGSLHIWGGTWKIGEALHESIKGTSISGDLYAAVINASKINLALLSEKVAGASSGDLITSRSFHIPGAGGFMLHERTEEIQRYYDEGKEIACFDDAEEMVDKVKYYLAHDRERNQLRENGYLRAQKEHTLDERARRVLKILETLTG